ncbi:MAG: cation:proton antiporter [Deltaproteobacteria bacterium]|nr:cation:proton antiporter [Deltaproteobacteria bacterium]MBW1941732.1 cation:proton antiporter [Deltaproteobacteria bacterium]MBW2207955.1 cation:proton antiporter [Deltaproteobacteria bacterium]
MLNFSLILNLLLILTVAWVLGLVFTRMGLPVMLGELLAGIILGPPILGIIGISPSIEMLAELGIFFVMFHTGMEMDPRELVEHIWSALSVAVGGFVLPFALGYLTVSLFGGTVIQSLFVGMGVSITAIAVQAVILQSMRINRSKVGHIIMGAAIADDILALVALSTLLGFAKTGSVQLTALLLIFLKVSGFFALTIVIGHFIMPPLTRRLTNQGGKAFMFAMTSALLMAYLAELAGLHLIIGAFLAGQFVRKEIMDAEVYEAISSHFYSISYGFLVPIFFASLSFHLHFTWSWSFLLFAGVLIFVAFLGKLVGCGLGASLFKYSLRESAIIGFGMNGRGAMELVVASVVLGLSNDLLKSKVISEPLLTIDQFSGLVLMAFVTTLMAPITLKWAVGKTCLPAENEAFCALWDEAKNK